MLLNAARIPVWTWNEKDPSICPDCGEKLIARRCEFKIWHWAHLPLAKGDTPRACHAEETAWRLQWKFAQMCVEGWEIEKRVELEGKITVLDTFNVATNQVGIFVHSTSKNSLERFERLKRSGYNCFWIYDGQSLGSKRTKKCYWNGTEYNRRMRMLKPGAMSLYMATKGAVHREDSLWKIDERSIPIYRGYGKVRDRTIWDKYTGEHSERALTNFRNAVDMFKYLK